jgi:hypothetical protein
MILGPPSVSRAEKLLSFYQTGNREAAGREGFPAWLVGQHCRLSSGRRLARVHSAAFVLPAAHLGSGFKRTITISLGLFTYLQQKPFHLVSCSACANRSGELSWYNRRVSLAGRNEARMRIHLRRRSSSRHPMTRVRPNKSCTEVER